jgi:hypothetical protein
MRNIHVDPFRQIFGQTLHPQSTQIVIQNSSPCPDTDSFPHLVYGNFHTQLLVFLNRMKIHMLDRIPQRVVLNFPD